MSESANPSRSAIDFWDANSCYNGAISLTGSPTKGPQYAGFLEAGERARLHFRLPRAEMIQLLSATDPRSESQASWRGHTKQLDRRIVNVDTPFWEAGITLPPPRPDDEKPFRVVYSLAPLICYQLGLLAARPSPSVVVFSNAFELARPAANLVDRADGTVVVIAYWRSLLDPRWERSGFLGDGAPLKFFDLEPFSKSTLGFDLNRSAADGPQSAGRTALPL